MLGLEEAASGQEFGLPYLQKQLENHPFSLENVPLDPYHYTPLLDTRVTYQGDRYRMLYKAALTDPKQLILRLGLLTPSAFQDKKRMERYLTRQVFPPSNPHEITIDDFNLASGEQAFRCWAIDIKEPSPEVSSRLQVSKRGQGLGTLLFDASEIVIPDAARRMKGLRGKPITLLVRDQSEGWASTLARKRGYLPVPPERMVGQLPMYEKILPPVALSQNR